MKFLSKILLLTGFLLTLSSCSPDVLTRNRVPLNIGRDHGFTEKLVKGDDFWITTYQHITNKNAPYVFYIEGDGHSFTKYRVPTDNPTPMQQIVMNLAVLDGRPNIVYVARPCQYTPMHLNPKCNSSYWAGKGMSEEVVSSLNEVINTINNDRPFSLVGYSGGGGIAVLIAARNKNVKDIITVAGNLDHVSFNKHHGTSPMLGSLNPIDYATKIHNIPQLHVSGGNDNIVPPFIADKYITISNSICVHQEIIKNAKHDVGWNKNWEYILTIPLTCYKN